MNNCPSPVNRLPVLREVFDRQRTASLSDSAPALNLLELTHKFSEPKSTVLYGKRHTSLIGRGAVLLGPKKIMPDEVPCRNTGESDEPAAVLTGHEGSSRLNNRPNPWAKSGRQFAITSSELSVNPRWRIWKGEGYEEQG